MPKSTQINLKPPKPAAKAVEAAKPPRSPRKFPKVLLHLFGLVVVSIGLVYLVNFTKAYVEQQAADDAGPLSVVLVNKPAWMSDELARQIAATVPRVGGSAFDHDLLVTAGEKLKQNAWVKNVVQIRRAFGNRPGDTLEVECDFRVPIALVQSKDKYYLVDNDGTRLPEIFTAAQLPLVEKGRDGLMNIRVISGVRQPPPGPGGIWVGQDLAAGLDLVKLFYGKSFMEAVDTVDVSNFAGRVKRGDPQIVLGTTFGTQIWWGQPINSGKNFFVEKSTEQKLTILEATVAQRGRIDAGNAYLDVRYEFNNVPTPPEAATAGARELPGSASAH